LSNKYFDQNQRRVLVKPLAGLVLKYIPAGINQRASYRWVGPGEGIEADQNFIEAKVKFLLPEPEFSLDEMDQAEKLIEDLHENS
jgi:hypothetical protein